MGIFDFFKKKQEDSGLKDLGLDMNSSPGISDNLSMNPAMSQNPAESTNSFNAVNLSTMGMNNSQYAQYPSQGGGVEKDVQILSLKLDAIKSELDNISQRVKNIESIAEKEQNQTQQKQQRWY